MRSQLLRQFSTNFNFESLKFHRKIQPNTTYKPRDLNESIQQKPPAAPPKKDVLEQLDINPLNDYTNPALLSHFLTKMGHIKNGRENGLSAKNQRRVARAIKRARSFGILPFTYKPF
jgi:small subunit ribosomal protein S18